MLWKRIQKTRDRLQTLAARCAKERESEHEKESHTRKKEQRDPEYKRLLILSIDGRAQEAPVRKRKRQTENKKKYTTRVADRQYEKKDLNVKGGKKNLHQDISKRRYVSHGRRIACSSLFEVG